MCSQMLVVANVQILAVITNSELESSKALVGLGQFEIHLIRTGSQFDIAEKIRKRGLKIPRGAPRLSTPKENQSASGRDLCRDVEIAQGFLIHVQVTQCNASAKIRVEFFFASVNALAVLSVGN